MYDFLNDLLIVQGSGTVASTSSSSNATHPNNNNESTNIVTHKIQPQHTGILKNSNRQTAESGVRASIPNGNTPTSTSERMKSYEDDLRRRHERKLDTEREQQFLRTSLRGSAKLKQLQKTLNGSNAPSTDGKRAFTNDSYEPSAESDAIGERD
jgi:hypothetical protein